mgnify:CR=1 FL=1
MSRTDVYEANEDTAISLCRQEVVAQESNREYEDITASVLQCLARLAAEVFGPAFAQEEDNTLDTTGVRALWELAIRGESNTTVLAAAYNANTTGAAVGDQATAVWQATRANVQDASFLVAQATAAGFGATRAQFAAEGRVVSYAYAEVAQCTAKYVWL